MSSYDTWKTTEEVACPPPSEEWLFDELARLQREVNWNISRLGSLILDDEVCQQTEDYVMELQSEIASLRSIL